MLLILTHKITRRFVFLLVMCSSVYGMNFPPFTIKFEGTDTKEHVEYSLLPMFPELQNIYNQGTHEIRSIFSPQGVRLALEVTRLKTKINEQVPLKMAIKRYKSALVDYNDVQREEASTFARVVGNVELAELISSLAQEMYIPAKIVSEPIEPIFPQSSAAMQPTKKQPSEPQSIVLQNPVQKTFKVEFAEEIGTSLEVKEGRFKFLDMLKERSGKVEGTTKKVVLKEKDYLDIGAIKLLNDIVDVIEKENITDLGTLLTKFSQQYPQDLTIADFNALIGNADTLEVAEEHLPIIKTLTQIICAERLIENPTPINLKPYDLKVRYDLDRIVAKTIMEKALARKYEVTVKPVVINLSRNPIAGHAQNKYRLIASYIHFLPNVTENNIFIRLQQQDKYLLANIKPKANIVSFINIGSSDNKMLKNDVSSDGKYMVAFFETAGQVTLGFAQEKAELAQWAWEIFPLTADVVLTHSGVYFDKKNYECYVCLGYVNGSTKYFKVNAADAFAKKASLNEIRLDDISDPWIQGMLGKFNDKEFATVCRGSVRPDVPFFNTALLHKQFYDLQYYDRLKIDLANYLKTQNISKDINAQAMIIQRIRCVSDSCIHYALIQHQNKTDNFVMHLAFNPDRRINTLLDFMNKKYESIKNDTTDSYALYPNALYIYFAYTADWYINPTKLRTQMGGLYPLVDPELKKHVEALIYKEHPIDLARYLIYQKYQPYQNRIRQALGTLWWSAKWGIIWGAVLSPFLVAAYKIRTNPYYTPYYGY